MIHFLLGMIAGALGAWAVLRWTKGPPLAVGSDTFTYTPPPESAWAATRDSSEWITGTTAH